MPGSLLFVTACHTVCRAVCYLLPHAIHCCHMLVQFLVVAVCRAIFYVFVAACCTIRYLLPLAIQLSYSLIFVTACRTVCYLLLHTAQFAILFSTYCTVSYFCSERVIAAVFTACYLLQQAVQLAICRCVLSIWLFIAAQASIIWGEIGRSLLGGN